MKYISYKIKIPNYNKVIYDIFYLHIYVRFWTDINQIRMKILTISLKLSKTLIKIIIDYYKLYNIY